MLKHSQRSLEGRFAEIEFEKECLKRGFIIAKPVIDNQPGWDYIVDFGDGFKKVQVKKLVEITITIKKNIKFYS